MLKGIDINSNIKVKLTKFGRDTYNEIYAQTMGEYPGNFQEDADGYSTWQIWSLMWTFGKYMGPSYPNCFDSIIMIDENEINDYTPQIINNIERNNYNV
jgi:hypothetical protein